MLDITPFDDRSAAYALYAGELAAFARGRVDDSEVDDLLQEVWSAYAGSEHLIEYPRAWLYRVIRNRITDLYRNRAIAPAFTDLTSRLPQPESASADPDELASEIKAALLLLPLKQREVFERNEIGGETLREIATDLGIPIKTAISRKGYARARLRDLLRETYRDYFSGE